MSRSVVDEEIVVVSAPERPNRGRSTSVAACLATTVMMIVGGVGCGHIDVDDDRAGHRQAASTVASSASTSESIEREVRTVVERQQAAWNRGDIDGFMNDYLRSDDLVFTSGARIRRGWNATIEAYRRGYKPGDMGRLSFSNLEVYPLGQDAAWVLGRWDLAGREKPSGGIFTLVFRRVGGRMAIVHDHTSSDEEKK